MIEKTPRHLKSNTARISASRPKTMSKTQDKYLRNQLKKFGFRSYREYITSEMWWETKERYRATAVPEAGYRERGLPQTRLVCHDPNVDLHHKTYKRLGEERLTDLVTLCRTHHDQLHNEGLDFASGPSILRERELELRRQRDTRPRRKRRGQSRPIQRHEFGVARA